MNVNAREGEKRLQICMINIENDVYNMDMEALKQYQSSVTPMLSPTQISNQQHRPTPER